MTLEVQDYEVAELVNMKSAYNPRKITPEEFERLKKKLTAFGCVEVIVVNKRTMRVVGGHQRIAAAHALGWKTLPISWVDLDETKEKELNLALNKGGGDWDTDALQILLHELQQEEADFELTGFEDDELSRLLAEADDDDIDIDGAGEREPDEKEHQTAEKGNREDEAKDIMVILGSIRFRVPLDEFELWLTQVQAESTEEEVISDIKERLGLTS